MYHDSKTFLAVYGYEAETTAKVLAAVTDESLGREKAAGHNTLGDIAWHIACAPVYMLNQAGFSIDEAFLTKPEQLTAAAIQDTHSKLCAVVKEQAATKTPDDLQKVYRAFGVMDWSAGQALGILLHHEVHHRGQLSVLLRQAGIAVPSIYGPTYEDTMKVKGEPA